MAGWLLFHDSGKYQMFRHPFLRALELTKAAPLRMIAQFSASFKWAYACFLWYTGMENFIPYSLHLSWEETMLTVLIDADGCPVVEQILRICRPQQIPVLILCDTAHQLQREGAQTLVFDKGTDSVDFALVNRVRPGDLVVTQDYGLASMCLARRARVVNQNGLEYTADNIDLLLDRRWHNKKLLRAGKHPKGPAKRTRRQNEEFVRVFEKILTECIRSAP